MNGKALFYIYAPDYSTMYSGVRCLHLLCHHLNRLGHPSYIATQICDPRLNTPYADGAMLEKFRRDGFAEIVVYPEVVAGNPLNAPRVVRYLLNKPGLFTGVGVEAYGPDDFYLHFADEFVPDNLVSQQLRLPLVDTEIYRMPNSQVTRETFAVYANRHQPDIASFPKWISNPEVISSAAPRTPHELAALYHRSRALITGERSSACNEAVHCGCPVLIIPNENFNYQPVVDFYDGEAFCIGFDADRLKCAATETGVAQAKYNAKYAGLDGAVDAFARAASAKFGL